MTTTDHRPLHRRPACHHRRPRRHRRRPRLRRGPTRLSRQHRLPGRRRSSGSRTRPTSRTAIATARATGLELAVRMRRPQRRRPQHDRRRSRHRRVRHEGARHRRRRADRLGGVGPDRRRVLDGGRRARPGDRVRRHRARSGSAGITLGGGIGYLVRKFGMTIDNLLAAEIVTADGDVLQVDADHHPDLFWAIRGGGGNFGVVTRFRFRLHDVSEFTGGLLVLPATAETVAGFIAAADGRARRALDHRQRHALPAAAVRPGRASRQAGHLRASSAASVRADAAAAAIAPLRALATPLARHGPARWPTRTSIRRRTPTTGPRRSPGRSSSTASTTRPRRVDRRPPERVGRDDARRPAARPRWRDGARPRRRDRLRPSPEPDHGQPSRRSTTAPTTSPSASAGSPTSTRDLEQDDKGAYVNFVADEGEERVRAAYPGATWDRLREVKRRYDPDNVFRRNQNVPPAEG